MKLLFIIAILLAAACGPVRSQNLVLNGSFEEYSGCPSGQGDIVKATPWSGFPATSDFFHRCGSGEAGVLDNGPGSQDAYSGSGYAGIIVNWNDQPYDYYIDEVSVIPENFELEIETISNPSGVYCSDDSVVLRTNLGAVGSSVWSDGTSNSSMTITTSGTYSVTTQVGCSMYEAQLEIIFEDCSCNLLVSDVFTPNDDGKNDVFQLIPVIEVARFELKIYNRWGKLVFETQNAQQGWNGKINGNLASSGVYLWTAKIFCIKNNQLLDKELKGYVSLLK
jgi:gliding motility-associated-like protein